MEHYRKLFWNEIGEKKCTGTLHIGVLICDSNPEKTSKCSINHFGGKKGYSEADKKSHFL